VKADPVVPLQAAGAGLPPVTFCTQTSKFVTGGLAAELA
jgi:hypothetical protein